LLFFAFFGHFFSPVLDVLAQVLDVLAQVLGGETK
jgi:hypothetical protein